MTTPPAPATPNPGVRGTARLAWLDALRGYAALVVVLFHLSPQVLGTERHLAIMRYIDLGKYGVLLFFLVSGYVIPMSLERHGSLRRFWIGRLCRVYPAYLATIALVAVLVAAGVMGWQASLRADPVTGALAHVTMMPDLVGVRGAVRVFWTLSYEMTFYLVVSGLFAWRLHRHSAWWAAGLGLAALLGGARLPDGLLGATGTDRRLLAGALVVVVGLSVTAYVKGQLTLVFGAVGLLFVLLPAVNGHPTRNSTVIASWQGLLLLAVMFAGTVVYRAQHGQIGRRAAALSLAVVTLSVLGTQATQTDDVVARRVWAITSIAVGLTFLLAYAVRARAVPTALTWLGQVSYSLYLLHAVVLFVLPKAVPDLGAHPGIVRAGIGVAYLLVVLALAWVSYHLVELPGQALGRRLSPVGGLGRRLATQRAAPGTGRGDNAGRSV